MYMIDVLLQHEEIQRKVLYLCSEQCLSLETVSYINMRCFNRLLLPPTWLSSRMMPPTS